MSAEQKLAMEIDAVLSSPSTVTDEDIAQYQEDIDAYFNSQE